MDQRFEALYPANSWEREIGQIIEIVKAGNSCQIIGFPGVGRSNLLGLLSYNRGVRTHLLGNEQNKFHFVLMNFSEARNMEEEEIFKFFFVSIIDSLKERRMEKESQFVKKILSDSIKTQDKQLLLHGLKKTIDYLCLEKSLSIIFLFDRFEEYAPKADADFFATLRSLRNRAKYRFSAVFSVERPLEDVLDTTTYKDFYEFLEGNQIYMPLRDSASLNFRIKFLEEKSGKKLPNEVKEEVFNLSAGHGKITRFCIEAYFSGSSGKYERKELPEFLLADSKVKGSLFDIWKYLTPEEQKNLAFSVKGIGDRSNTDDFLEKIGLVKDGKITMPLFEEFIAKNKQELEKTAGGKIVYEEGSNEIKKGEVAFSDILTSSEFKLLKFLVQNEGKILERDEIVNTVWTELSSTAGVTEQALDQLIFRVRKKIEDNPNSPIHILTVKGRGFKFTP